MSSTSKYVGFDVACVCKSCEKWFAGISLGEGFRLRSCGRGLGT